MGYAEMGCQGCKDVPTPNIDRLAKNGVRCTNGYVSCPVCSPTRAGLMTGRYQQRFGHEFNPGNAQQAAENFGLPLTETTLPARLKEAGYATGMVGKWHLGYREKYRPTERGFQEFFGFLAGAHPYDPKVKPANNPILRGTEVVEEKEYLTDAFAREAVAFVEKHQKEPFFLYLPFNAVHGPLQGSEKYLERFAKIEDEKRRKFAAMLSALDDAVGLVVKKVEDCGLEKDTLIFFVSDNGGPTMQTSSRNDPLNGRKGQVLEGGIRVPFLVQWKGTLPADKVYEKPVIALDIHPTACAAAGVKLPDDAKLDGVNLLPYLKGENDKPPHETLYWRFGQQSAVRKGDLKLVKMPNVPVQLFDLSADVGEKKNLAEEKPELVKELDEALKKWDGELIKPLWGPARQP
jgi:arylsulfatase A-like enzyme